MADIDRLISSVKDEFGGVRVNAVSPGPILTPLNMVPHRTRDEQAAFLGKMVPLGRVSAPEDVANVILFPVSDEASFVLGSEFVLPPPAPKSTT
jgi:NAD(P)-dependent dehydrogenase (short-subunit alcohol dehydrogenase family)